MLVYWGVHGLSRFSSEQNKANYIFFIFIHETDEGLHGRGSFHLGTLVLYRQHETIYDIPTLVSHTVGLHAHFDCIYP